MSSTAPTARSFLAADPLADLSGEPLRLLRTDRVTEALEEIYGPDEVGMEVLRSRPHGGAAIERIVRFRRRSSGQVLLVARSTIDLAALRAELGSTAEGFLASLEREPLGRALRATLGAGARSADERIERWSGEAEGDGDGVRAWLEWPAGAVAARRRSLCAPSGRKLVTLTEYVAAVEGP